MNNKQLITMWVGIVLVAVYGLSLVLDRQRIPVEVLLNFVLWAFTVVIVTGGLIVTFADKKPKDE
jgi:prolipoprotein diacylglyceryltransferase